MRTKQLNSLQNKLRMNERKQSLNVNLSTQLRNNETNINNNGILAKHSEEMIEKYKVSEYFHSFVHLFILSHSFIHSLLVVTS